MTDDADLVAVGIPEIGAIIVGMIVRAQARRTLVLAAGRQACLVGGVDGSAVGRVQADGDAVAHAGRLLVERTDDPELRPPAARAPARGVGIPGMAPHAERLQRGALNAPP